MNRNETFNVLGSLRWRIVLALCIIVTVTSTLFAFGVLRIKAQLEQVIFDQMAREQLQLLLARVDAGSYDRNSLFKDWSFHFGKDTESLHPNLLALAPGSYHSVRIDERYYQVEVGLHHGSKVFLTYDITDWENQEHALLGLLAWGIGGLLLAAILMGWQASRAILAPVRSLTGRLATIHPRQRAVRIGQEFQGNEIGQIARAFDQYLERLDQFVERERSFTAAASHELRTPLSVMLGAIDVLESQQQSATAQRALARLKRACGEMRAFIETTLLLSREDSTTIQEGSQTSVAAVLRDLLEDNQPQLQQQGIDVTVQVDETLALAQPASLLQILFGNILRNAIEHTRNGRIEIEGNSESLRFRDTGSGIAPEHLPRVFDRSFTTKESGIGLGLDLVRRICERCGWQVTLDSEPGAGTTVTIRF